MTDALPKNNNSRLKWWQKGALVGFGIALIIAPFLQFFLFPLGRGDMASVLAAGFILLALEFPVFPFFLIIGYFLVPILPFSANVEILLFHFISWTLGGIIYAGIFHTNSRLTKHSPLGIGIGAGIGYLIDRIKWKKILIIAALIAVGATGYLGYHWYKTSQLPAPITENEIADWKVYRNVYSYESDYWGYEIKYPPDWIMTEYEGVHQAKWTSPRTMPPPLREIFIETPGAFRHGGAYIDTINCTWSESQKEWFEKNPELESKTYPRPIGKEKIGKIEFCKMQDIGGDEMGKIGGLGIRYEVFKNGWDYRNTLWAYYNIFEDYQPSESEFQYELDVFKKILSTFKFIEK